MVGKDLRCRPDPCVPDCQNAGTDCACHLVDDPLPDLVINKQRLADEILFDHVNVGANSCSLVEPCVGELGDRRVLRFSVEAVNQGQATLTVPPPEERPDLFVYSTCHGHYHFSGFASYALLDPAGHVVVEGRKQAYCMEDTIQVAEGPNVGCSKVYDCSNQGIQPGWSDLYGNDCQWLDITGIPAGNYQLKVSLNPNQAFQEVSFDNNTAVVPVSIPAP
jgi:lysyl oxidase